MREKWHLLQFPEKIIFIKGGSAMEHVVRMQVRLHVLNPDTGEMESRVDIGLNMNQTGLSKDAVLELFDSSAKSIHKVMEKEASKWKV